MENNTTRVDNKRDLIEGEIIGISGYKNDNRRNDEERENNRGRDSSPHTSIHPSIHSYISYSNKIIYIKYQSNYY